MISMTRRYGPKATEKIGRTMHEFKHGKLKSGSGGKVTSRQQAIAIGLSQARRAGYKVPPERAHASMSLDTQVRAHLSNMRPGTEVDARGVARALGGVDPLEADYALERAERAGLASSRDGRWFGPPDKSIRHHAKMLSTPLVRVERVLMPNGKTAEIHIHHGKDGFAGVLVSSSGSEVPMSLGAPAPKSSDEALRGAKKFLLQVYGRRLTSSNSNGSNAHSPIKLKDRSRGHVWLTVRDGRVVGAMGSDPERYTGKTLEEARHLARYGGHGSAARSGNHSTVKLDKDDAWEFGRYAKRMGQTHAQALVNARAEGFAAYQLGAVEEGWEAEHSDTLHGGFPSADSSHAVRRKARAPRVTAYRINLTPDELRAIELARGRYAWPDMLSAHMAEDGSVAFTEREMWQWVDDVDSDAEGGHSSFPLASPAFAEKLQRFYDARV